MQNQVVTEKCRHSYIGAAAPDEQAYIIRKTLPTRFLEG